MKAMSSRRANCAALLVSIVLWLAPATSAVAHPMGNFSVNHYSRIVLESGRILVRYFIDLAEIPAYQELQQGNIPAEAQNPAVLRYIAQRGTELGRGLDLSVDGQPLALRLTSSGVIFPPGAGGLPTMKMGYVFAASYPPGMVREHASLRFADNNYPGHSGWKEIVAAAEAGSLLSSSVPAVDCSAELSNYPTDLLHSPPQSLDAALNFQLPPAPVAEPDAASHGQEPGSVPRSAPRAATLAPATVVAKQAAGLAPPSSTALSVRANRQQTPRSGFTELIRAQRLSPWFLFCAAFIAMGLGGLHALEPGHGKTIVAAYLVGSRGTARHAALLGAVVTLAHTASVFALGAVTLYASRYIVPEQLYPWLGVTSGVIIAALGCYLLLRRLGGADADHSHAAGEAHFHWFGLSRAEREAPAQELSLRAGAAAKKVTLAQLFTLGVTGGIVPCPAALVVLLSAFALHRVALGFFLIVAFSFGLAAVLIGFGMLMVYARRWMSRLEIDGPLTRRWLPIASSLFIALLGVVLATQSFASTNAHLSALFGFLASGLALSRERIGPLLFVIGLGLVLGMRHSTDADHVVAISTIVSKQRGIRSAAFIGSVWGLGHTITIFLVGSLVILFGVVIPPRIGLAMEFSVAVMLVLLGVLNLSGLMSRFAARFAPAAVAERAAARQSGQSGQSGRSGRPGSMPEAFAKKKSFADPVGCFGWYQCLRPLVVGLVHGLAGSAAVALLVLSTIHDPVWASIYLLIFGAGTMLGMMCMTAAIAVPLTLAGERFQKLGAYMGTASGVVSVCFGSFLVYQLGFLGGLFTSHPQWTPR